MVRISIILFVWSFICFRLNIQWVELYEITYDITILLSSAVLAVALSKNHKKYMFLSFMFSLPIFITGVLNYKCPGIETITEMVGAISALIVITYLLITLRHGIIQRTV